MLACLSLRNVGFVVVYVPGEFDINVVHVVSDDVAYAEELKVRTDIR